LPDHTASQKIVENGAYFSPVPKKKGERGTTNRVILIDRKPRNREKGLYD